MTYGEIYKEFLIKTQIPESSINDYRPANYIGFQGAEAICLWLNDGGCLIYQTKLGVEIDKANNL